MFLFNEEKIWHVNDDEYFFEKQKIILDKLKSIDINEVLLHKIIKLISKKYLANFHDLSRVAAFVLLDEMSYEVDLILGLYEELSKDMFIYMMFSKEGILNNENRKVNKVVIKEIEEE